MYKLNVKDEIKPGGSRWICPPSKSEPGLRSTVTIHYLQSLFSIKEVSLNGAKDGKGQCHRASNGINLMLPSAFELKLIPEEATETH